MPTERRFDIKAIFKSYCSEILEIYFPLGSPVVKLAILFLSQIGSSWTLASTKLTVHILVAAVRLIVFGREHYNSVWINYAISTRLGSLIFHHHAYGFNFYPNLYPFGFAVAMGTWVSVSLSFSAVDDDDILPWRVSKTIQVKIHDRLNPLNAWSQTIESKKITRLTSADFFTVPTVWYHYFFPQTKPFNEIDGYLNNDTIYLEISFIDPPKPLSQSSLLFPFP